MSEWDWKREPHIRKIALLSEGLVDEVEPISQPNNRTCVHTCLSMVTGIPMEDIIYAFGDHRGLTHHDEKALLGLCGIRYTPIPDINTFKHGINLGTIQSLNHKNTTHRIIIVYNTTKSSFSIIDPNQDIKGKCVFTMDIYIKHSIFNILHLERSLMFIPGKE